MPPKAGVQDADVETARNRRRISRDEIVCDVALPEALAVQRDIQMRQAEGLGLARRKHADIGRQRELAGDLAFGIVIAVKKEDGNSDLRQPAHLLDEEEAGLVVAPITIIEIAGDDDEIDLVFDRLR